MRIIILGGDGYLGWPTSMHFASLGWKVWSVDNYMRRHIAGETDSAPLFPNPDLEERCRIYNEVSGNDVIPVVGDCRDFEFLSALIGKVKPDAVVHYAEQPSAPYSMRGYEEARLTLDNNLKATFNLIWAIKERAPSCHLIKLGTMGEYGTPNIDIEEGWLNVTHKGRSDKFLYPRQAGSLYHTTKILDTDLLWFYVRTNRLRVTDLMQGPVYGLQTDQTQLHDKLRPNFHYDDIFGTVLNRFLVQAVCEEPLTVYGKGGQTRGYLNLKDTLQCVQLAAENPVLEGELRILNQFTEQFSVNELAEKVRQAGGKAGLDVRIEKIPNPRKEAEDHYYNAANTGLKDLGLKPHLLTQEALIDMLDEVGKFRGNIDRAKIMPRVSWNDKSSDQGHQKCAPA